MMQQVNLYGGILKQQQQQSGDKLASLLLAALLGLFVLISFYLWWHAATTAAELKETQELFDREQNRLDALAAKRSGNQPNPDLIAELKRWQTNVNEAAQTVQLLNAPQFLQARGFSPYLKALALHPNPEVWLTAIHIDGKKGELKLEGSTFKPEQIPQTLQQFQAAPALKGHSFAKLSMTQSEKIPGQIDFSLGSPEPTKEGKDDVR